MVSPDNYHFNQMTLLKAPKHRQVINFSPPTPKLCAEAACQALWPSHTAYETAKNANIWGTLSVCFGWVVDPNHPKHTENLSQASYLPYTLQPFFQKCNNFFQINLCSFVCSVVISSLALILTETKFKIKLSDNAVLLHCVSCYNSAMECFSSMSMKKLSNTRHHPKIMLFCHLPCLRLMQIPQAYFVLLKKQWSLRQ